jgi:thiol:disulfide interchange protein DsbA
MFVALHVDRKRLVSQDDQREFFVGLGVEANAFDKAYNSFSINSQLRQGNNKIVSYGIQGVPALIINGKYIVNAGSAGGNAEMLKVADFLIAQEKK